MRTVFLLITVLLLWSFSVSAMAAGSPEVKKAIVVTSFGTTFDDARKLNIESIVEDVRAAFPDYDVRLAFTSRIIMKRLAERGIYYDSLEATLDKLQQEGYQEIVVQPALLTPGEEFDNKIMPAVEKYREAGSFDKLLVGRPMLTYNGEDGKPDDFLILAKALKTQMPKTDIAGKAVILMGHGSPHRHNPAYETLQAAFDALKMQVVIGVVEEADYPNFKDVLTALADQQYQTVLLMPLLLVSGDHANNDMAGDDPSSWKNQLVSRGFAVEAYMHGMGENPAIRAIFVQHVRDALLGN